MYVAVHAGPRPVARLLRHRHPGAVAAARRAARDAHAPPPDRRTARRRRWTLHAAALVGAGVLGYWWSTATGHSDWLYRGGFVVAALAGRAGHRQHHATEVRPARLGPRARAAALHRPDQLRPLPVALAGVHRAQPDPGPVRRLRALRHPASRRPSRSPSCRTTRSRCRSGAARSTRIRLRSFRLRPGFVTPVAVAAVLGAVVLTTAGAPGRPVQVSAAEVKAPRCRRAHPARPPPGCLRPPGLLLVGDSVANSLAPGIQNLAATDYFQLWNASVPGCGLASDLGQRYTAGWESQPPTCAPGLARPLARRGRAVEPAGRGGAARRAGHLRPPHRRQGVSVRLGRRAAAGDG